MTEKDLNKLMTAMQTMFKWIRKKDKADGGVILTAYQDDSRSLVQMRLASGKLDKQREDKIREIAVILDAWKLNLPATSYKKLKQIAEAILGTIS